MSAAPAHASNDTTQALVDRFNAAWNDHDLPAALAMISGDCVFEATGPAPDGSRHVGRDAIEAAWAPIFANEHALFTVEQAITADEYVVQQWRYDWGDGHVRGIDLITANDGLITSKLAYVKG